MILITFQFLAALLVISSAERSTDDNAVVSRSKRQCRTCLVGNQVREGNREFSYTKECFKYNCFCKCDGSWNCPEERSENICNTNPRTGCSYCTVDGSRYEGNSRFKHVNGCLEFDCMCNCDGSWNCPAERTRDTCRIDPKTGCSFCEVGDKRYTGNDYFKYVNGCIEYNCVCNCDGSWNCPGERAKDLCRQNRTTGCYYCEIDDYIYQGGSRFDLVRECFKYPACNCACDGGWTCAHTRGISACNERGIEISECTSCRLGGKAYRGNSMFYYDRGCIRYICTCSCDGTLFCPSQDVRQMCLSDDFRSGSVIESLYAQGSGTGSSSTRRQTQGCSRCSSDGVTYEPNSSFQKKEGCNLFVCNCRCDGTVNCPSDQVINTCVGAQRQTAGVTGTVGGQGIAAGTGQTSATGIYTDSGRTSGVGRTLVGSRLPGISSGSADDVGITGVGTCRQCKHKDLTFEGGRKVSFELGCFQYNCECRCNGDLVCPSDKSRYICPGPLECIVCKPNLVPGLVVQPNTTFTLTAGCAYYNSCRCNCDGGWTCGEGIYTCEIQQGCEVAGKRYASGSRFNYTNGCDLLLDCACHQNGSWFCEGGRNKTIDLCGGCRKCKIGDRFYNGGTAPFSAEVGCTRYQQCTCNCNGAYSCTGGIYTCTRGDQPPDQTCEDCVHDGRTYRNEQSFDYRTKCQDYRSCQCKCGKTTCRSVTDTCGDCRSCHVNNVEYPGGSKFNLRVGCTSYTDCDCSCDSTWKCSGKSAVDTCNTCRKCEAEGRTYDPYSKFTLDKNDFRYQCFCLCNGTAYCPAAIVVNTKSVQQPCSQCTVAENGGRVVRGNSHFDFQLNGMGMYCRCNCDGSYVCIGEWYFIREDTSISGSGVGSGIISGGCFQCDMNGRTYAGDTRYVISRNGITLNCECFCNGGYYCYGEKQFENLSCRSCSVYGRRYEGESRFSLVYSGLKLSCQCSCDSSYICYGADSTIVITCPTGSGCLPTTCNQCIVDGARFNGGDEFGTVYKSQNLRCLCGCDGSYYCEGDGGLLISCGVNGRCVEIGCGSCSAFGTTYPGERPFEVYALGMKLTCNCECGGSYECYGYDEEIMVRCRPDGTGCLPSTCAPCLVGRNRYAGLAQFRHNWNGLDMMCTCACDGSYYCTGISEVVEVSCVNGQCRRLGCGQCRVYGEVHEGDSSFPLIYGGMKLQCQCSCDSGYVCRGVTNEIVVQCVGGRGTGCLVGRCLTCSVDGREFAAMSQFRSRYQGIDIQCTCGCDGNSYCVGVTTSIEVSCRGGSCVRIGCKDCSIFGRPYLGGAMFDIIYGGNKITCDCDCDGGYVCKSETGVVIVRCVGGIGSGCLTESCNQCVANNRRYDGGQMFRMDYKGIAVECTCSCDGSYYCTGITEIIEISCGVNGVCQPKGCKTCSLFGRDYEGASQFQLVYSGLVLDCECGCNGDYTCYGEGRTTIFQCRGGIGNCMTRQCQSCQLDNGQTIPAFSEATLRYNNYDVRCQCGCDGSVYCKGVNTGLILTCIGGKCIPIGCSPCMIYGQRFESFSIVDVVTAGYSVRCQCGCSGGYTCSGSGYEIRCVNGTGSGCLVDTCRTCSLNGQTVAGKSVFKYRYNGVDMSCTCGCDGSVFCKGVTEIIEIRCIDGKCYPLNCRTCTIFGQERAPFSRTKYVVQGLEVECACDCDGGYQCFAQGKPVQKCEYGRTCYTNTCRDCVVDGVRRKFEESFPYRYKNKIDMTCRCGCDGTSYCEGVEEVIYVSCIGDTCGQINCGTCSIFGRDYPGDSEFDIVYKGVTVRCGCNCDTSYRCKGHSEEFECAAGKRGGCLPQRCRVCRVNGNSYEGMSSFKYNYQGVDMNCVCGCDGTYACKGVNVVIVIACQRREGCRIISGCRDCDIYGVRVPGNGKGQFLYDGYEMDCQCKCDSSYRCLGTKNETIVDCGPGRSCLTSCGSCRIDGRDYRGNTQFDAVIKEKNMLCQCGCDGSYHCTCKNDGSEYICDKRGTCTWKGCSTCVSDGRRFEAFDKFEKLYDGIRVSCGCNCDGSYRCTGINVTITIVCTGEVCRTEGCRSCTNNGRQYNNGEVYEEAADGSYRKRCRCQCDGSVTCENIVQPQCTNCVIDGKTYKGHSQHRVYRNEVSFICACQCNGQHTCAPEEVRKCPQCLIGNTRYDGNTRFQAVLEGSRMDCSCDCEGRFICTGDGRQCTSEAGCVTVCKQCTIDGQVFRGGATASPLRVFGDDMTCTCGCDGVYECRSPKKVCTLASGCVSTCQECVIGGRRYEGNTRFQAVLERSQMECSCDCEGKFVCTGDGRSCTSETGCVSVCKQCTIDGQSFRGGAAAFAARVFGDNMTCTCGCDGVYECRSPKKVCTLARGCVSTCQECVIGGRRYEGNTRFQAVLERSQMECSCDCEGRFVCTGDGRSCTSETGCVSVCKQCTIDGQSFRGGAAAFTARVFGDNMTCTCGCDGVYECRSPKKVCTLARGCVSTCQECVIGGRRYEGNTRFQAVLERSRMECSCECDGRFVCTGDGRRCTSETGCVTECKQCTIDGQVFRGAATAFAARVFGEDMTCTCACDGVYECRSLTRVCTLSRGCVTTCQECAIGGRRYPGGSTAFDAVIDGTTMRCSCDCNGGYDCRSPNRRCTPTACVDICFACSIAGREYESGTTFDATLDATRMRCTCDCQGNYECRGSNKLCTPSGCVSTCQSCTIGGRQYSGGTTFDADFDGTRMRCSCDCLGSYECTGGDGRICTTLRGCYRECRECVINGRRYNRPDVDFQADVGGVRMTCRCDCVGGYRCVSEGRVCTDLSGCTETCPGCVIEGRRYAGNTQFEIFHSSYGINMQCACECGGSYKCNGTKQTQKCFGDGCPVNGCNECEIDGRRYAGNSRFEAMIDNVRMQCTCSCSGNYRCEGNVTDTKCYGTGCSEVTGPCGQCYVRGKWYAGNTQFAVLNDDGIVMECTCECNGRHTCVGKRSITVCDESGCKNTGESCLSCIVDDREVPGNTRFQRTERGIDMDCVCKCTGEYKCEGRRVICEGPNCGTSGCKRCVIDGVPYTGNTRFNYKKGNAEHLCTCFCDGTHSCTGSGFEISCLGGECAADKCRNCVLDNTEYQLDSRFRLQKEGLTMSCVCECDGAYRCFSISGTCLGKECDSYGCKSCSVDGRSYAANSEFDLNGKMVCTCACDGQYNCRSKHFAVTCTGSDCGTQGSSCKRCNVDGDIYEGNSRFQITKYGLFMQCACNCDSTYTCRGYQIISTGERPEEVGCRSCEVGDRRINGNTRFQMMVDGERQVCSCNCNGEHSCSTPTSECRNCFIDGREYTSNQDFTLTRNGNNIRCTCQCNGDFVCVGRRIDNTVFDGCSTCSIFGVTYKGDTRFTTDVGGVRMLCECQCSGEYKCRGYRTVTNVLLPAEVKPTDTCTPCYVAGQERPGNSRFQIQRSCYSIDCICGCDGNWDCPQQVPRYTCTGKEPEFLSEARQRLRYSIAGSHVYTSGARPSGPDTAVIFANEELTATEFGGRGSTGCSGRCYINDQEYAANAVFVLQDGCLRWSCTCDCNGQLNCTNVIGTDCTGTLGPWDHTQCKPCTAFGGTHAPNQWFTANDTCYRYRCMCSCDGTFECPPRMTVQTCDRPDLIFDPAKNTCRKCVIGENEYAFGTKFQHVDDCNQYECTCKCDGSYSCPGSTAVRVCRAGSGSGGRPVSTGGLPEIPASTGADSGRTFIAIRPSGFGRSFSAVESGAIGETYTSTYNSGSVAAGSDGRRGFFTEGQVAGGGGGSGSSSSGVGSGTFHASGSGGGSSTFTSRTPSPRGGSYDGYTRDSSQSGSSGGSVMHDGCEECIVNGEVLKGGRDFTFRKDCVEHLCECYCNGTHFCDPAKSVNFCEEDRQTEALGCKVGNRVYKTKLFSYVEDCKKHVCRCYSNGSHICDQKKMRVVC